MRGTNNSKLVVKAPCFSHETSISAFRQLLRSVDIDLDRVVFLPHTSKSEHYKLIRSIDVMLDAYPYNGVTSTFESLANGTPVISLAGDRFVSRNGLSILANAGLEDLSCSNFEKYVAKAIELREVPARLSETRERVTAAITSSIFDPKQLAQDISDQIIRHYRGNSQ